MNRTLSAAVLLALAGCSDAPGVPEAPCSSDDSCSRGLVCRSGFCVAPEPDPSGPDGGILVVVDGGSKDEDGGLDGGENPGDSGSAEDSGLPVDVGTVDGGQVDGGVDSGIEGTDASVDAGGGSDAGVGTVPRGNYSFQSISINASEGLWRVAVSPDGATLVAGNYNAELYVVDRFSQRVVRNVSLPRGSANSLLLGDIAFSEVSGELLVALTARMDAGEDGRLYRIVDARTSSPSLVGSSVGMFLHEIVFDGADANIIGYERLVFGGYIMGLHTYTASKSDFGLNASFPVNAGCQDLALADDGSGQLAQVYTCGIGGGDIGVVDQFQTRVRGPGAGNVSFISARPQGDYALAVAWTGTDLLRFERGLWTTGLAAPELGHPGLQRPEFSSSGERALVVGEYNDSRRRLELREYRHGAYSNSGITDVSISGFNQAPYFAPDGSGIFDVAWRPGCDEGYMVGGCGEVDCGRGWLIRFQATNGTACP